MLVLSRKEGESVILEVGGGELVEVKVIRRGGGPDGQMCLGFDAPMSVGIYRKEAYQQQKGLKSYGTQTQIDEQRAGEAAKEDPGAVPQA